MERKKKKPQLSGKWKEIWEKTKIIWAKIKHVLSKIGKVLYHLRKLFLAAPVVYGAIRMYQYAQEYLPESVGILLQETGDYMYTMEKSSAIYSCLALTGICLVLMFCSRRTIYPWVISIFSLVVPLLLIVTNMYPA